MPTDDHQPSITRFRKQAKQDRLRGTECSWANKSDKTNHQVSWARALDRTLACLLETSYLQLHTYRFTVIPVSARKYRVILVLRFKKRQSAKATTSRDLTYLFKTVYLKPMSFHEWLYLSSKCPEQLARFFLSCWFVGKRCDEINAWVGVCLLFVVRGVHHDRLIAQTKAIWLLVKMHTYKY